MEHLLSFWNKRDEPNIMFITYEDMKSDLPKVIQKVSSFLCKPIDKDNILTLAEFLSFDHMRSSQAMNREPMVEVCVDVSRLKPFHIM